MNSLPDLHEAVLDEDSLDRLIEDVSTVTQVIEVRIKVDARSHASPETLSLAEAIAHLRDGRTHAAQVRYRHAGAEWLDTLQRVADGYRLVRIGHHTAIAPQDDLENSHG